MSPLPIGMELAELVEGESQTRGEGGLAWEVESRQTARRRSVFCMLESGKIWMNLEADAEPWEHRDKENARSIT